MVMVQIPKSLSLAVALIGYSELSCSTKASPIYGNLPAGSGTFGIATEAGNTFGIAVEFTPQVNVDFNCITLWLSGYTGLDGSSLQLSLMQDGSSIGFPFPGPATTVASGTAPANNGAEAAFNFSLQGQLQANTPYWLFLYLQVPNGGTGINYGNYNCLWNQGGDSTGNIVIDGSEEFADGFLPSSFQSDSPAFAINAVPEISSAGALLAISLGACFLARRQLGRRSPK